MNAVAAADPLADYLHAAVEGDTRALTALVRATQSAIWRLCCALGSPGEEEDLVQDAYLRIVRSLPTYKGTSPVLPWMLAITRNVCADHVRRRTRQRRLTDRLRQYEPSSVSDAGDHSGLDHLLHELAADRREAFVLTQLLGLTYEETSMVVGCPIGTVRSRVARARQDLVALVRQAQAE